MTHLPMEAVTLDEVKTYTLEEAHQHFARTLNGKTWELLHKPERSRSEDELMVDVAHASSYHWLEVGTGLHHQRAEWLIARVYSELGMADTALKHASRCLELTDEFEDLMQDFDRAYAYEGLARANAAAGNRDEVSKYLQCAEAAGQAIRDEEDRNFFFGDFNAGNWYGLR
jgi:tetratricopeptide (TPR) repeat protein